MTQETQDDTQDDTRCDLCDTPWEVRFEWDYTGPERYCLTHLLEPIAPMVPSRAAETLLDWMPDCQQITHRPPALGGREVRYGSTEVLSVVLQGRPTRR